MKVTEEKIKEVCGLLITAHSRLMEAARLNGNTGASILGVSRSRYGQLVAKPGSSMLHAHVFLNLLWSNNALEKGLEQGWLPASASRGAAQEHALEKIRAHK